MLVQAEVRCYSRIHQQRETLRKREEQPRFLIAFRNTFF